MQRRVSTLVPMGLLAIQRRFGGHGDDGHGHGHGVKKNEDPKKWDAKTWMEDGRHRKEVKKAREEEAAHHKLEDHGDHHEKHDDHGHGHATTAHDDHGHHAEHHDGHGHGHDDHGHGHGHDDGHMHGDVHPSLIPGKRMSDMWYQRRERPGVSAYGEHNYNDNLEFGHKAEKPNSHKWSIFP
jgi:hypothetical protein